MRTFQLVIMTASILLAQTPAPIAPPAKSKATTASTPNTNTTSQPFGLKGDLLGETIDEFRARNERNIPLGGLGLDHAKFDSDLPKGKHLPQCTTDGQDEESKSRTDSPALSVDVLRAGEAEGRAGVIKCVAALSLNDDLDFDDGPTIAGIRAYRTVYYFFRGRLYMISSVLPGGEYRELRTAFIAKYGPASVTMAQYQNSLGAKSTGEQLRWKNGASQMVIDQLGANRIGRTPFQDTVHTMKEEIKAAQIKLAIVKRSEWDHMLAAAYEESLQTLEKLNDDVLPNNILLVMWHTALRKECEAAGALDRKKDI